MAILKTANTTDKYRDDNARIDLISYVTAPNKTPHGYCYGLGVDMSSTAAAAEDMRQVAASYGKDSGVRLRHFIISFAHNEIRSLKKLNGIAWEITAYLGNDYQVVSAVHEDGWNYHIHFIVNAVNRATGERYSGTRKEFIPFKEYVRDVLLRYGIKNFRYVSHTNYEAG